MILSQCEQGEIPAKIIQVKVVTPENLAVIQKSYTLTLQSAEQDKKTEQPSQSSQSKDQSKDQGQAAKPDQSGDKAAAKSEGQPGQIKPYSYWSPKGYRTDKD